MDLISIIMPVKNTTDFISDCLDSIVAQTESNWELIAIDDHSTDKSGDILRQYSEKDARIKVYQNDGQGIIPALRLALSKSHGNLITRMDSDDLMDPEKLYEMKQSLVKTGKGHLALGLVEYFSDDDLGNGFRSYEEWLNGLTLRGTNFDEIYKECVIPSPCWMVYREDLEACGGFDSDRYPEDYDLCFRFYEARLKCIPSKQVLHFWRDHPSRASRTDEHYADNRFLDIKLHYFLQLNHDPNRPLVLWGAGKKGKAIAADLVERNQPFHWICNNSNKIGQVIHGQELKSCDTIDSLENPQIIVVVANEEAQNAIRDEMMDQFFFC
ncbi:MAG: glycosyltransferase family 2 protein [Candidatus Peregrinibacteria bacterium]|nr:glycosyltransferase family 2 protein [Candidatus Peregrinibacteria bacterium]